MIRPLVPEDVEPFFALRLRGFQTDPDAFETTAEEWQNRPLPEIEKRLRQSLISPDEFILGAFAQEQMVGVMGFQRYQRAKIRHKGFFWGVYVAPEQRQKGLGGAMLEFAIRQARGITELRQIQLSVAAENRAAYHLYLSRGFVEYGLEKEAYFYNGHTVDERLMQLFL